MSKTMDDTKSRAAKVPLKIIKNGGRQIFRQIWRFVFLRLRQNWRTILNLDVDLTEIA